MNYIYRNNAGSGWWCSILLPLSLLPWAVKYAGTYKLFCVVSFWIAISFFLKEKVFANQQVLHITQLLFYKLLLFPATMLTSLFIPFSFTSMFVINYSAIIMFDWLVSTLRKCCPGSFTSGEAQVISQGVTIFMLCCGFSILNQSNYMVLFEDMQIVNYEKFLQILLLGCIILIYVLYKFPFLTVSFVIYIPCMMMAIIMLLTWYAYLGQNPVIWLFSFCFYDSKRIFLLSFWVICTLASIFFVIRQNRIENQNGNSVSRKYFHGVVIFVFLPGIILDPEFLKLASGVAMAVFIALETFRVLEIPPFGPAIDDAFQVFLDEKDSGILILTHIYLLIGCSCPLWMYSFNFSSTGHHICLLSGVISVGFGDTAAALGGSMIGKHRWNGSLKTLEGTACAIIAQILFATPFLYVYHEFSTFNVCITFFAILLTSVLEAKTTQVDNLVLPLFMYSFLSWIK